MKTEETISPPIIDEESYESMMEQLATTFAYVLLVFFETNDPNSENRQHMETVLGSLVDYHYLLTKCKERI